MDCGPRSAWAAPSPAGTMRRCIRPHGTGWRVSLVRAPARDAGSRLDDLMLYDTALNGAASPLRVAQLPAREGEAWIGLPGPSASLPGGRASIVALTPAGSLDLDRLAGGRVR